MSWLFIALLNFPRTVYRANYPVTAVVFSSPRCRSPKSLSASKRVPPTPPSAFVEKVTDLNLNGNSISVMELSFKEARLEILQSVRRKITLNVESAELTCNYGEIAIKMI